MKVKDCHLCRMRFDRCDQTASLFLYAPGYIQIVRANDRESGKRGVPVVSMLQLYIQANFVVHPQTFADQEGQILSSASGRKVIHLLKRQDVRVYFLADAYDPVQTVFAVKSDGPMNVIREKSEFHSDEEILS